MSVYLQLVRANGGYKLHVKPSDSNRALCGHEPADNAHMMHRRGRWILLRDQTRDPTCARCKARMLKS